MNLKDFLSTYPDIERGPDFNDPVYQQQMDKEMAEVGQYARANGIPFISALVIVKDINAGKRSQRWVELGLDATEAITFVGSFARLDFALWAVENGHLDRDYLLDNLPDLWRGSDPDDTDPRFSALWVEARERNGGAIVTDLDPDETLPVELTREYVTVYRGELGEDDPRGIAWSLDQKVARKFAKTGGLRGVTDLGGTLHWKRVRTSDVLGYLHHRSEAEVVLDPEVLL